MQTNEESWVLPVQKMRAIKGDVIFRCEKLSNYIIQ